MLSCFRIYAAAITRICSDSRLPFSLSFLSLRSPRSNSRAIGTTGLKTARLLVGAVFLRVRNATPGMVEERRSSGAALQSLTEE